MEINYWAGTDVGRKRSDNEDNFLIDKRLKLFIVADGMGGHASGEVASAMAVHEIRDVINRERDIFDTYDDDDPKSHVEVCTLLEYAVHHACAQIFHKARREPEKRGMGTTLVALLFIGDRGFIAYVGDSRIYLLRGGIVYQLTEDHSLRNELIRMGKITAEEFETSPYANLKNAMTRAVGVYESVEVDTLDFDVIPGDSFMLCSDGLYEYLSDDDIANTIGLPELREVPGMLIDSANKRGGKDNITAVVVQVAGDDNDQDRAAELNFTLDILKTVPLFRELSYQQLVRVINLSKQSVIEEDDRLFEEGEPGQELLVLLRGRVELYREGVAVAEVGGGAHLGEMSLIDSEARSATAIVTEPGKLLSIQRDDFYNVLRREPALAVKLLWSFVRVLADRLRQTTADLATARTAPPQVPDLTDLTDLAEVAARNSGMLDSLLDPDDEDEDDENSLENRRTLISTSMPSFTPPSTAPASAPQQPAIDPRRTLISTTTSNVAPSESEPEPEPDAARPREGASLSGAITTQTAIAPAPTAPESGGTVVGPPPGPTDPTPLRGNTMPVPVVPPEPAPEAKGSRRSRRHATIPQLPTPSAPGVPTPAPEAVAPTGSAPISTAPPPGGTAPSPMPPSPAAGSGPMPVAPPPAKASSGPAPAAPVPDGDGSGPIPVRTGNTASGPVPTPPQDSAAASANPAPAVTPPPAPAAAAAEPPPPPKSTRPPVVGTPNGSRPTPPPIAPPVGNGKTSPPPVPSSKGTDAPAVPPPPKTSDGAAVPPPPPVGPGSSTTPPLRGDTQPTPTDSAESDAPKRPATRAVTAAPQATPGVATPPSVPPSRTSPPPPPPSTDDDSSDSGSST
ncbi:MAG: cyclic nucleotide-binding domain-containing protein [Myxococcota bacterium]